MSTPEPALGEQESGKAAVAIAIKLLERALLPFGAGSTQGRCILKAITTLTKDFGMDEERSQGLGPAEMQQMAQSAGAGGGTGGPPAGAPPGGMPPGTPSGPAA